MPTKREQKKRTPTRWARAEAERIGSDDALRLNLPGFDDEGRARDLIAAALDRAAARENRACWRIASEEVGACGSCADAFRKIRARQARLYGGGK